MFRKIQDWLYEHSRYGIRVDLWIIRGVFVIIVGGAILGGLLLFGQPKKAMIPDKALLQTAPNMPPKLRR